MQELDDFIIMIMDDRFSDAHVILEAPWKMIRKEDKDEGNILKGLINAASAFELKRLGREEASLRIWGAFEKYRPLIDSVASPRTEQYHKCVKVLERRYEELF